MFQTFYSTYVMAPKVRLIYHLSNSNLSPPLISIEDLSTFNQSILLQTNTIINLQYSIQINNTKPSSILRRQINFFYSNTISLSYFIPPFIFSQVPISNELIVNLSLYD